MRRSQKLGALTLACFLLLVVAGIMWPVATAPLPDPGQSRLIVNARVIDVERGTASSPTRILIRRGRIAGIGEALTAPGVPLLDARGGYLLPGLWDMHVHSFQHSPRSDLPLFVANGLTGVRDMMDCPEVTDTLIACVADKRRWSREAEAGRMASPRFIEVASFYFERPDMSPDEAARLAAKYKARGLDVLKVYNRVSRPTYWRLAAEAKRLNMRLVGHLPKAVSLDEAIAAGQTSFEHARIFPGHCFARAAELRAGALDRLDPTLVAESIVREHDPSACARSFAAMVRADAWFVPTHVTREEDARAADPAFVNDPRLVYLDPLSRWAYRDDLAPTLARYPGSRGQAALDAYFKHGLKLTGQAYRAGVPVLVGSDTGLNGFRFHDEMAHLVSAGLTPAEVLRAATLDAARYARADNQFGTVSVGKRADLVLLAANPLANIANARRVQAVFVNGRLYDRARLDALLAFVRRQANSPSNWLKLLWGFVRSSVSAEL